MSRIDSIALTLDVWDESVGRRKVEFTVDQADPLVLAVQEAWRKWCAAQVASTPSDLFIT